MRPKSHPNAPPMRHQSHMEAKAEGRIQNVESRAKPCPSRESARWPIGVTPRGAPGASCYHHHDKFDGTPSPLLEERTPRHSDALCAPEPQDGPLTPALSPSEGERENRRQLCGKPRFMGRVGVRGNETLDQERGSAKPHAVPVSSSSSGVLGLHSDAP
jgi:hypothetical protein